jgi:hypothetical protein
MARMTPEERAQYEALADRARAEDEEDQALEVVVEDDKGRRLRLKGQDARKVRRAFGLDDDDPDPEGGGAAGEEESDPEPAGGYFRGRKKAA